MPKFYNIPMSVGQTIGQTVNYGMFDNILSVQEDVLLVRIVANFHVIPDCKVLGTPASSKNMHQSAPSRPEIHTKFALHRRKIRTSQCKQKICTSPPHADMYGAITTLTCSVPWCSHSLKMTIAQYKTSCMKFPFNMTADRRFSIWLAGNPFFGVIHQRTMKLFSG